MKKILITGKNSYIGNALETRLLKEPNKYEVDKIDLRDSSWQNTDFSEYSSIIHAAGIAHRKETKENKKLFYSVNRDLAVKVAIKAKEDGVQQFIFLSSMSIYGKNFGAINKDTPIAPFSHYGKSKYEAEVLISSLEDDLFKVAILRPPMVYGRGCKGNYAKLSGFIKKYRVFPKLKNKRSMIYIENLVESIKVIFDYTLRGTFCPQNKEYVATLELAQTIGAVNGFKVRAIPMFETVFEIARKISPVFNKVGGDLVYDIKVSKISLPSSENINYNIVDFITSIKETEQYVSE